MTQPYSELSREHWTRTTEAGGYVIRAAGDADASGLARLAQQARRAPGARDASTRSWRHGNGPAQIVLAEHSATGALHAAFGTDVIRVTLADGAPGNFGLVTTLLEHPDADHVGEPCLALRCAWRHFELFAGADGHAVVYGSPSLDDLKLGRRDGVPGHALDLEVIRTENLLRLPARRFRDLYDGLPSLPVHGSAPGEEVFALYEKVRSDWGASTLRDAAWFRWRYDERPGRDYRFGVVPGDDASARALTVASVDQAPLPGSLVLLDWICEPFDYDAGLTLLRWAIDLAEQSGCTDIVTLLPEWTPWFTHLQWNGLTVHETPWFTVARGFARLHSGQWLRDAWFYTLGDLYLGSEQATP